MNGKNSKLALTESKKLLPRCLIESTLVKGTGLDHYQESQRDTKLLFLIYTTRKKMLSVSTARFNKENVAQRKNSFVRKTVGNS